MSYGSKVCPTCHGEVRVYFERGGHHGVCPNCGHVIDKGTPSIPSPGQGDTYDLFVDVHELDGGEWKVKSVMEYLRTYTDRDKAIAEFYKIHDPLGLNEAGCKVWAFLKGWNHDHTEWEWVKPDFMRGMKA